ncbi:MAG: hypothetical protein CVU50_05560 [Candidatus Cloacimonetes bacterium HGW-Cloacimonetes-3]|jgi:hypothetical protein|nr:MAG: hypothetical protein CVU50_05560 [Candidatus Cloacimonetes bacterium HGW-Cloacimonetes-3]
MDPLEVIITGIFHSAAFTLVLTCVFLLLNILDGHSTYLVLKPNHYEREKNPIARWVFRKLQIPRGIVIFKVILMSILIVAIAYYAAWDPFTINIAMLIANLLFTLVVLHNYRIAKRLH